MISTPLDPNPASEADALGIRGVFVAMLPVTDLAISARWYRDLLGLEYMREFVREGVVTGCALYEQRKRWGISFRLRSTMAGEADLRNEHPLVFEVVDRAAVDRLRERAESMGYSTTSGEHADAYWFEVVDPDGIASRFGSPQHDIPAGFTGVEFHGSGDFEFFDVPRLMLDVTPATAD